MSISFGLYIDNNHLEKILNIIEVPFEKKFEFEPFDAIGREIPAYNLNSELSITTFLDDPEVDCEFANEDYQCDFKIRFSIYVIWSSDEWPKYMLKLLNQVIKKTSSDFLLECNGEAGIVLRKNQKIFVDPKSYAVDVNFEELAMPWSLVKSTNEMKNAALDL
ncbi:MAG: hypothetical protein AAGB12_02710 [Pseudomonadota bacterium]